MKLILHIGAEKTGSSTIQYMLQKNESALLDQGYYFINSTRFGLRLDKLGPDSRIIATYCSEMDQQDEILRFNMIDTPEKKVGFRESVKRSLDKQLGKLPGHVHTIIASSEHLHSRLRSVEEVTRLRELFAPYVQDTKIICYLRNQADTVVSLYSTALKGGGALDLDAFVEAKCDTGSHYFNYDQFISKWEQVYGQKAVNLRIFSKDFFVNSDLVDDFLAQVAPQLTASLDKVVPVKNESINHLAQVLARSINKHIPLFVEGVGSNADNVRLKDIITSRSYGKGLGLSRAKYKEISSWFVQSNERVRQRYFPDRMALFEKKQAPGENRMLSYEQELLLDDVVGYLVNRNLELRPRSGISRPRYTDYLNRFRKHFPKRKKHNVVTDPSSFWQQVNLLTKGISVLAPDGSLRNPLCINNSSDRLLQFTDDESEFCAVGWKVLDKGGELISDLRGVVRIDADIDANSMGIVNTVFSVSDEQQQLIVDNSPCFVMLCIVHGDKWVCDSFPLQSAWSTIVCSDT